MKHIYSQTNVVGSANAVAPPPTSLDATKPEVPPFVFPLSNTTSSIINSVPHVANSNSRVNEILANMPVAPYNTIAYSIPPQGSGIPYGPLPKACFKVPPQSTQYTQPVVPHSHDTPSHSFRQQQQTNVIPIRPPTEQPLEHKNIREQMDSILNEHFGVEPKGRARV